MGEFCNIPSCFFCVRSLPSFPFDQIFNSLVCSRAVYFTCLLSGHVSIFVFFQVMTAASLPSTCVKCLYLFFDLPPVPTTEEPDNPESEFSSQERRVLLQKVFVQVCFHILARPYQKIPPSCKILASSDPPLMRK